MLELAQVLTKLLENRKMTQAELAKACTITRPTLYQYMCGKRPLKNKSHLDEILDALQCTPTERSRANEAFQMEMLGEARYLQRKKVAELFAGLPKIYDGQMGYSLPDVCTPLSALCGSLSDENAVVFAAYALMQPALKAGSDISVILQLENEPLLASLLLLGASASQSRVRHVICLEKDVAYGRTKNIERTHLMMKYSASLQNYLPLFYYGNSEERFDAMSIFSGLILTDGALLMLSADGKRGYLSQDTQLLQLLHNRFEAIAKECRSSLIVASPMMQSVQMNMEAFFRESKKLDLIDSGLCFGCFWDEARVRTYLNRTLPDYEKMVAYLTESAKRTYEIKRGAHVRLLTAQSVTLDFVRDGLLRDYPPEMLDHPVSVADRRDILECVLQSIREGWQEIFFFRPGCFPIKPGWTIGLSENQFLHILSSTERGYQLFSFEEAGVVNAAADYFDALVNSEQVLTQGESIALLQSWMAEYLTD